MSLICSPDFAKWLKEIDVTIQELDKSAMTRLEKIEFTLHKCIISIMSIISTIIVVGAILTGLGILVWLIYQFLRTGKWPNSSTVHLIVSLPNGEKMISYILANWTGVYKVLDIIPGFLVIIFIAPIGVIIYNMKEKYEDWVVKTYG